MSVEPLHLKLQGLWVGAALGELYAKGLLNPAQPMDEATSTVQMALPQTYRLCLLAARWLKADKGDINADVWNCKRWQDALLNVLPLHFLHGADSWCAAIAHSTPPFDAPQRQTVSAVTAIIQTLEWLQRAEPPQYLLPYLLQTPSLQETTLAEGLSTVYQRLGDRRGLSPLNPQSETTPEQAMAQVLYLLLGTPEDFRLTVQRSAFAMANQPELQILLAALSGFHNGFANLPLDWRCQLKTIRWSVAMPLEEGLCTLANLCAAQWAGCYEADPGKNWSAVAIAASGQLRPR
jgi:hypothetical protein